MRLEHVTRAGVEKQRLTMTEDERDLIQVALSATTLDYESRASGNWRSDRCRYFRAMVPTFITLRDLMAKVEDIVTLRKREVANITDALFLDARTHEICGDPGGAARMTALRDQILDAILAHSPELYAGVLRRTKRISEQ
jgi:hypothetical protein